VSTKVIEIVQDGSYRAGQPAQLFIHDGDTVEFKNGDGGGTTLVLTEQTRGILSPSPASTTIVIAAGSSVSFQIEKASQLTYCCQVLAEGEVVEPISCESAGAGAILSVLSSESRSADAHTGRGL
jgi:plastocyanin